MNELPGHRPAVEPARSFDLVADAYDRARPSYPEEAVSWLLGSGGRPEVVELGAGTGKLTQQLLARRCTVIATDPSEAMLARLVARAPGARVVAGRAEQVPLRSRSADLVVAAQAFHWFDTETTLREVARVLRPGGRLAMVWNSRDERIPWVKRLGRIIGTAAQEDDPSAAIDETGMFETVERATFRFWQPLHRESLRDLVASRSTVAVMSDLERERVLRKVDELYDEYGRGADGMLLPYVTTACRTTVLPWALPPESPPEPPDRGSLPHGDVGGPGSMDDDALLIDFR
ncbi:MAG TPA: class I SAM-dependent methyltransferase [Nocardioidaceae bacterium]|jgi:ubiquinone/menaquinone biosynthesis C-methylase UbiE|nr:class I SAM-dependent methyltransferase [Nocardioidaceae bacterium]